jgi:hypothetical protein
MYVVLTAHSVTYAAVGLLRVECKGSTQPIYLSLMGPEPK